LSEQENAAEENDLSEDELSGDELKQLQGGIIEAITNFENCFKFNDSKNDAEKNKIKKKRAAKSSERILDRLAVKQSEPGNIFQAKQTGNGGCCVSFPNPQEKRSKSNDTKQPV
jgi:hypothetical protein